MAFKYIEAPEGKLNLNKIESAVNKFEDGQVVILPTNTCYVMACKLANKQAIDKIHKTLSLSQKHLMTLLISDFSALGKYAVVDNFAYRMIKRIGLEGYTFILRGTKEVSRGFLHKKRKTVGLRVSSHPVLEHFIKSLQEPLACSTLRIPASKEHILHLDEHLDWIKKVSDLVIDAGELPGGKTTILDLSNEKVDILRQGIGSSDFFD